MADSYCRQCGRIIADGETLCLACSDYDDMQTFTPRIVTNGDRLRAMKSIELAAFIGTLTSVCNEQRCEDCPIGRIGCLCDMSTIHAWLIREAEPR